ncbi:MAG: UDP-2,3-diacylglucosamine diphosphatase [Planctomycetota bacterium]
MRSIWISDLHLGTKGAKTEQLLEFLEAHECERLYLVGDIIDGWVLRKGWYWNESHNQVVSEILRKDQAGTEVVYVCGNHDEFLRSYLGLTLGGIRVVAEAVHTMLDGRKLLVLHGDRFDTVIRNAKWLALLGDQAYRVALWINDGLAFVRRRLGLPYWSLSAWLKGKVKEAVKYVDHFGSAVLDHAERHGMHGVVCGHIHKAELREERGRIYANDGDWVESCTALVETRMGELEIVDWPRKKQDPGYFRTDSNSRPARSQRASEVAV